MFPNNSKNEKLLTVVVSGSHIEDLGKNLRPRALVRAGSEGPARWSHMNTSLTDV